MSASLKVPKNTVASIMLKWKKFGTTKTLPGAGRPAKTAQSWEKGLGEGSDQKPNVHSDRAPALQQSGVYGRVARRKPLFSKRHDNPLGVCQKAPKGLRTRFSGLMKPRLNSLA